MRLHAARAHAACQAADEDGSGELDVDEFCTKLGPHLGANMTREQVPPEAQGLRQRAGALLRPGAWGRGPPQRVSTLAPVLPCTPLLPRPRARCRSCS